MKKEGMFALFFHADISTLDTVHSLHVFFKNRTESLYPAV